MSIKVKSSDLLAAVDLLNFLSATNYYAEAIAGSIMSRSTQSSNASVAGSLALVYFNNRIEALVGRNVEIDVDGDATIEAKDEANARIIDTAARRLGIPHEKFYLNIERLGNTSSASIPIALDELARSGKLERGDKIIFCAFGGGLSAAAALMNW